MLSLFLECLCLIAAGLLVLQQNSLAAEAVARKPEVLFHPSRIIAKPRAAGNLGLGSVQALTSGFRTIYRSEAVPGLVVFDLSKSGADKKSATASARNDARGEGVLETVEALRRTGRFEFVEPDYVQTLFALPNDAKFADGTLWGLQNQGQDGGIADADIGAVSAWEQSVGSRQVIVAVIDTGVRYTHQDLRSQMWRNPDEIPLNGLDDDDDGYVDNIFGIDAFDGDGNPDDDNGHGTHVAGIIGAAANNGSPHVGVAWEVQIMACRFLGGEGFGFTSDAIRCIDYAASAGARIINASWGGGPYSDGLFEAISAARDKGVLFVAAAGNSATDNDREPSYPAGYALENVISVAALDRRDRMADFSNYGLGSVDLGAPGVEIYSCGAAHDRDYVVLSGTSMAAPFVSGAAVLVLGRHLNASLPELRARLSSGVAEVSGLRDRLKQGGRLNVPRALDAQPDGVAEVFVLPAHSSEIKGGSEIPLFVTLTDVVPLTNAVVRVLEGGLDSLVFNNDGIAPDVKAKDATYTALIRAPNEAGMVSIPLSIEVPGMPRRDELLQYHIVLPPVNDNRANAIICAPRGGTFVGTNRFATMEPSEPAHAQIPSVSASVWWAWTPARDQTVLIDTAGTRFDCVLAVYTSGVGSALIEVAAVDDVGDLLQGNVQISAKAGVTYYIAVAGYGPTDYGGIRLRIAPDGAPDKAPPQVVVRAPLSGLTLTNVAQTWVEVAGTSLDPEPNSSGVQEILVQANDGLSVPATGVEDWKIIVPLRVGANAIKVMGVDNTGNKSPTRTLTIYYRPLTCPNDHFGNASELLGRAGFGAVDNTTASLEFQEPIHAGAKGGKSVWWRYRPTSDGAMALDTKGSSAPAVLAVYEGEKLATLNALESNEGGSESGAFSEVIQAFKAGKIYYIALDSPEGAGGVVRLNFSFEPGPVYFLAIEPPEGGSVSRGSGYFPAGTQVSLTALAGRFREFDRWDGDVKGVEDSIQFVITGDTRVRAIFRDYEFTDGFESGDLGRLNWRGSGGGEWRVQSEVVSLGRYAARSGKIKQGEFSSLAVSLACREGIGRFDLRVSSEKNWDVMEFFINGARIGRWSGDVAWTTFEFPVSRATNRFEWRYKKDVSASDEGLDAAFLDNLDLPVRLPPEGGSAGVWEISRSGGETVGLKLSGQRKLEYVLQQSVDLRNWVTISTNVATNGVLRLERQPGVEPGASRFFRSFVP